MMRATMVALVLAFAVSNASAQAYIREPERPDHVAVVHKNPRKPLALSIIGALSGLGIMYGAMQFGSEEGDVMKVFAGSYMVIAPAFGEWFVQDRPVFTFGAALRLGGFAVGGLGVGADTECNAITRMTGGGTGCVSTMRQHASDTMLGLGLLLGAAGTIYDIVDAPRQARARRFIVVPTGTGFSIVGAF
jgi:hypothetical protein